jgi:hypothetical protein
LSVNLDEEIVFRKKEQATPVRICFSGNRVGIINGDAGRISTVQVVFSVFPANSDAPDAAPACMVRLSANGKSDDDEGIRRTAVLFPVELNVVTT